MSCVSQLSSAGQPWLPVLTDNIRNYSIITSELLNKTQESASLLKKNKKIFLSLLYSNFILTIGFTIQNNTTNSKEILLLLFF